jgi:hypothetical protein
LSIKIIFMKDISLLHVIRTITVQEIQGLSVEQFNTIPAEFNNNIIWNAGHLVASEQRMLYLRSGKTPLVSAEFFTRYQKGSRPEGYINEAEINAIKNLLRESIERFEQDYKNNLFVGYDAWTTSYGNPISNLDDAITFLPFHEGLHLGCIKTLKKIIK